MLLAFVLALLGSSVGHGAAMSMSVMAPDHHAGAMEHHGGHGGHEAHHQAAMPQACPDGACAGHHEGLSCCAMGHCLIAVLVAEVAAGMHDRVTEVEASPPAVLVSGTPKLPERPPRPV